MIFGCVGNQKASFLELPKTYGGASAVRLDEYSVKEEVIQLLRLFNDTVDINEINQLWSYLSYKSSVKPYSSTVANKDNLITFRRILNDKNLNVSKITSVTFETLFALSRLPIAIYLVTAHLDKDITIGSKINSLDNLPIELENKLDLSLVKSIARTETGITFSTTGHFVISGKSKDIINGNITLLQDEDLLKSFDLYIVSRLPINEIEGYIKEWHQNLSYEYQKPQILDLKQE